MAIRQVIRFKTRPGKAAEFAAGFRSLIDAVVLEPGCEQYELLVSQQDADTLVMLERWADIDSLETALSMLRKPPADPAMAFFGLLDRAPVRERYEV